MKRDWKKIDREGADKRNAARYYAIVRDFFKAAAEVWGESWGNSDYMVTKPVTLKAMIRVCADLAASGCGNREEGRVERWRQRLAPWDRTIARVSQRRILRTLSRQRPG